MDTNSFIKALMGGLIIFVVYLTGGLIAGEFWYQKDTFTAEITTIKPHSESSLFVGNTKYLITFNDGRTYDMAQLPELTILNTPFTFEYREPYFVRDPYLVVVK